MSAPKETTDVLAVVLAVWVVEQGVPREEVQVYVRASPEVGGEATEGPEEGEKSEVILS